MHGGKTVTEAFAIQSKHLFPKLKKVEDIALRILWQKMIRAKMELSFLQTVQVWILYAKQTIFVIALKIQSSSIRTLL